MWDREKNKELAESRVTQLEQSFWKPPIEAGARHQRLEINFPRHAWGIINDLKGVGGASCFRNVARKLNETTAGQALYTQFQKLLREQKETIKQLQDEAKAQKDPELGRQLEVQRPRLEAELQKTWDGMDKLKIPFFRRFALHFSKKTRYVGPV